jgi:hypothetical protein
MNVIIVQTNPWYLVLFFPLFFKIGVFFFPCLLICYCYVVRSEIFITLSLNNLLILFGLTLIISMNRISIILKNFCYL